MVGFRLEYCVGGWRIHLPGSGTFFISMGHQQPKTASARENREVNWFVAAC
jgi:hypothetical protein